jgi:hypothetical protein
MWDMTSDFPGALRTGLGHCSTDSAAGTAPWVWLALFYLGVGGGRGEGPVEQKEPSYFQFYGDTANLDGDNDGIACEGLP